MSNTTNSNTINVAAINFNSIIAHKKIGTPQLPKKIQTPLTLTSETKLNNKHKIQFENYTLSEQIDQMQKLLVEQPHFHKKKKNMLQHNMLQHI